MKTQVASRRCSAHWRPNQARTRLLGPLRNEVGLSDGVSATTAAAAATINNRGTHSQQTTSHRRLDFHVLLLQRDAVQTDGVRGELFVISVKRVASSVFSMAIPSSSRSTSSR